MARRKKNARTRAELMENSPAQEALLEALRDYKKHPDADGNNPTYEELGKLLGVSSQTAYTLALRLVDKKILRWGRNRRLVLGGQYLAPDELPETTPILTKPESSDEDWK